MSDKEAKDYVAVDFDSRKKKLGSATGFWTCSAGVLVLLSESTLNFLMLDLLRARSVFWDIGSKSINFIVMISFALAVFMTVFLSNMFRNGDQKMSYIILMIGGLISLVVSLPFYGSLNIVPSLSVYGSLTIVLGGGIGTFGMYKQELN